MRRSRLIWLALPLSLAALVAPTGNAAPQRSTLSLDVLRPGFQGEDSLAPGNLDARVGMLRPTSAQQAHAKRLGADAFWNQFGTPRTLSNVHGYLSPAKQGDPVAIARQWLRDNAALFRLSPERTEAEHLELVANNALHDSTDNRRMLAGLKPLAKDHTLPHVVLFRQVFEGGLEAGQGGMVTLGLDTENRVTHVSSSITGNPRITNKRKLDLISAWRVAAADAGLAAPAADKLRLVTKGVKPAGFTGVAVPGLEAAQVGRLVAMPTPRDGVRVAWEVNVVDTARVNDGHEPLAYNTFVDAQTGRVLYRKNAVDHLAHGMPRQVPDPRWKVFPNTPQLAQLGVPAPDDRETWCWSVTDPACTRVIGGSTGIRVIPQLKFAYDEVPVAADQPGVPSDTSKGNYADTRGSYVSHLTPDLPRYARAPESPRHYIYPFEDQWHESNCDFSGNQANATNPNDLDAAIINLFVNYGRMHNWSYYLGFKETTWNMQQVNFGEDNPDDARAQDGDPEMGQAQAGAAAGSLLFTGRDNANQITLQDGTPGVTNQYLWHPLQGAFYSPCVDGAFDMTVVGHEYTHAISNRMIGGPNNGISGDEGGSMGEGWSDLAAMEYVNGYGFAPVGNENPFAVGPYATGNLQAGIRNYGMNDSPLNYSQLFYDGNGQTSPHSDSEIWSAANFAVRQALTEKWDSSFDSTDETLQYQCADGLRPENQCPGNRRWIRNVFDAFLLQDAAAGMPEAARAQIDADKMRYKTSEENTKEMWRVFAEKGMGDKSEIAGTPDWTTPVEVIEAKVQFRTVPVAGGGVPAQASVFVGPYTGRTTEAGVSAKGALSAVRQFVPGKYFFTARADGYGMYQFEYEFEANEDYVIEIPMRKNHASETSGAEATGDGGNHAALIDDSEESNWAFLGAENTETIEGKQVTVDLAGTAPINVKEVAISAMNRPEATNDPYDSIAQNRFASLRSFEILACNAAAGVDCEEADSYDVIYASDENKPGTYFPSGRPRPTSENLRIRTFDVADTDATHIRLRVLTNHCTGNPIYTREQSPVAEEELADPDCVEGHTFAPLVDTSPSTDPEDIPEPNNTQRHRVRAAELQVFSEVTPALGRQPVNNDKDTDTDTDDDDDEVIPTTGASPVLPVAGLLLATASAFALRRRRTA